MNDASQFEYDSGQTSVAGITVVLDGKLVSRDDLFSKLSRELEFPVYFGRNWDALIDCLSDLSWITGDAVTLRHEALPSLSARDLRIYLECLLGVLARKKGRSQDRPP